MTAVASLPTPKLLAGRRVTLLFAGNAVGAACIAANWWATADNDDLASDLASAWLAIAGLVVAGLANAWWLCSGRGAIARRRVRLSARVLRWAAPLDSTPGPAPARVTPAPSRAVAPALIAVEGATLYHRPGCPLVTRKRTAPVAAEMQEGGGLRPCGVCEPLPAPQQNGALQ